MKPATVGALWRYAAVGVAATAAHFGLLTLLVEGGACPAWLASGFGALLGAQVAFFGNRRLTFGHRGPIGLAWRRFMGTAALGAVTGMLIVATLTAASLHYLFAQAVATLLVMLLTFAINRAWTFGAPH
jgi:putative flippase GtrA